ncbi:MAG: hypothetical protein LBG27_04650 [Spirochaetaceae bacterium]|nr:hypothetical protein [Spirochaetaceae bacterium]
MTSCGLNGKPLAGQGRYGAGAACNQKSAAGACKTDEAAAAKAIHPFITQNAPDYDPDGAKGSGAKRDGEEYAPFQYIANMRDGSAAGFKYFALECLKEDKRGNPGKRLRGTGLRLCPRRSGGGFRAHRGIRLGRLAGLLRRGRRYGRRLRAVLHV